MTIRIYKSQLKQELLSSGVLPLSIGFSLFYLTVSSLLLNFRLLSETFTGSYAPGDKLILAFELIKTTPSLYAPFEFVLLLVIGVLMGMNLVLIAKSLKERRQRDGTWSLGLGLFGAVATTGCASCGLTFLSLIGPSVSLTLLPFQTMLLQGVSLVLLTISLMHTLNRRTQGCIIATK